MKKFIVYSKGIPVGSSELESGDPPMGVAFGEFQPNEKYSEIKQVCMANHADQSHLELSVKTETGVTLECAGVGILDYSAETDQPYAEVNVLGIPYPQYEELFPEHVAQYERQFIGSPAKPSGGA